MPKSKKPSLSDEKFTLFPFLDALSGVVGVLALIICALSMLETDKPRLLFAMPVNKTEKQPHHVECIADGVVIHPTKKLIHVEQINAEQGPWTDFLTSVKENQSREYVVLLLRMDGLESYDAAMKSIQKTGVDVGREIVRMHGEIEINLERSK